MNVIDIFVIILILLSGVIGFKRGVFKEVVLTVGWILIFLLAWYIKTPIATFLSLNLPFLNFWGAFKGVTVINILLYQLVAFAIIYSLLMVGFRIVLMVTGAFEKILKATIILGIPSKILGFIVGLIEGYILAFLFLFAFSQPIFNIPMVNDSSFKNNILEKTPILSPMVKGVNSTVKDIIALKNDYTSDSTKDEFNRKCIESMLEHKMVSKDYIKKLADARKIKVRDLDELLSRYE